MKLMKTEDAVGQVLCHDITQIIKGVTKDAVFRKGHIITEEDIPVLLSVGKDNIYIWEKDDTMLHENEAAQILYDMCKNDHFHRAAASVCDLRCIIIVNLMKDHLRTEFCQLFLDNRCEGVLDPMVIHFISRCQNRKFFLVERL